MSHYTPEQWQKTAFATLAAARLLYEAGAYRSCASRAYYAAYQIATSVCVAHGNAVKFPTDWNNPSHEQLPGLIRRNGDLSEDARREVRRSLVVLREARESADYKPGITINKIIALDCLRQSAQVMSYLGASNEPRKRKRKT